MKTITNKLLASAFMVAAFSMGANATPVLNPTAATKNTGVSLVTQIGNTTTVDQSAKNAKLYWTTIDTNGNETLNFVQPGKNSVIINEVTNGQATQFLGTLNANGNVVIQNQAGVTFGAGSRVNAGSLTATTAKNFDMNTDGTYTASGFGGTGAVNLDGTVTAASGGYVNAIAKNISVGNGAVITANNGTVQLQAGAQSYTVDLAGNGKINYSADNTEESTIGVGANSYIGAQNGEVLIRARSSDIASGVINLQGVIDVNNLTGNTGTAGTIKVSSTGDLTTTAGLTAYGKYANGGTIKLKSVDGKVNLGGTATSSSLLGSGGTIDVKAGGQINSNAGLYANSLNGNGGTINLTAGRAFNNGTNAAYNATGYTGGGTVALTGNGQSNLFAPNEADQLAIVNQVYTGSTYGAQGSFTATAANNTYKK